MPESCDDLWKIGHTLKGFYLVKAIDEILSIFCDFDKIPGDEGIQKIIGSVDIKSVPVYFFAQARTIYNVTGTTIPFDAIIYNIGSGLDLNGTFTAPKSGNYYFTFNGLAGGVDTYVDFYLNDVNQRITAYASNTGYVMSLATTIFLNTRDHVKLVLRIGMLAGNSYNNLNGFLLDEKLS